MKGIVDKSLSSQNGQIPNFIFHARKEFVIITTLVLQDPGQDGIREPRAWMDLYNRKALGS